VKTHPLTLGVEAVRASFPALGREEDGRPVVFADAPGGTQVPAPVVEAMRRYLTESNANTGGPFSTSVATDALIAEARRAAADLLGSDPEEVAFGSNMTTLAFALSRSLAKELRPGDQVVVTRLDHDANIAPWLAAAEETGAAVRWVDVRPGDCSIDLDSLDAALSPRTRIVAFTLASNAVGTVTPAAEIVRRAHGVGAVAVADAVHLAPHRPIDVRALDVDALFCSPYKFFGPHLGIMFGRRELLSRWRPFKVRPQSDAVPDRWETGTLNHEGLAGLVAAVDYLAGLGRGPVGRGGDRRRRLVAGMEAVRAYEAHLSVRFLERAAATGGVRLFGVAAPGRAEDRTPTFALRVPGRSPRQAAEHLAGRGVFTWDGNYFALAIMQRLGLEGSGGALRVGFCHYNTLEEVDRVARELAAIV
jgi:cysteine desulfurase family protein (TIGR01976 family)